MASIPVAISRQVAIDRIIQVMQLEYADVLEAIRDENLHLPAPAHEGYYYVPQDPDDVLINRPVAVFVQPTTPRMLESAATGGMTGRSEIRKFRLSVTVIFKMAPRKIGSNAVVRNGKTITDDEIMFLRAERYTGAMVEVIESFACGGDSIHGIELLSDTPDLFFPDDRTVMGVATTEWEITQKILMPTCKKVRENP